MSMKVWSEEKMGTDGKVYSIRYLLDSDEVNGLQQAGIVSADVFEVIGMQRIADVIVADFEKQAYVESGGIVQ